MTDHQFPAPTIGRPRVHHRLADSTNERAKELAAAGAPHGTLVTAAEQSAGRGRQGRVWTAPPGRALLMSAVLRDVEPDGDLLPLAAAVAVCEACEAVAPGIECEIKWPNDVWIERRKVAGILVEGRPQQGWMVLGIGLNVATGADEFPQELRETATSLAAAGASAPVADVLAELLPALDRHIGAAPDAMLDEWRARDALLGRPLAWEGGVGTAQGITDAGDLLVETDDGQVELRAGEVHLRG
jgi:BirA family transcriptional regulator, biotin operon repressor / biotin---[acetyl-CoA-carboxylase] ligase